MFNFPFGPNGNEPIIEFQTTWPFLRFILICGGCDDGDDGDNDDSDSTG